MIAAGASTSGRSRPEHQVGVDLSSGTGTQPLGRRDASGRGRHRQRRPWPFFSWITAAVVHVRATMYAMCAHHLIVWLEANNAKNGAYPWTMRTPYRLYPAGFLAGEIGLSGDLRVDV